MKKIIIFAMCLILVPFFIVGLDNSNNIINKIKYGIYNNEVIKVKRVSTGEVISIPLEEYVIGVVAGEMPASFDIEALKAQAIASRTYVLKRAANNKGEYDVVDSVSNQVYLDNTQMKEKWPITYEKNLSKIKEAVLSTKGQVLLYNNNIIDAMFFSTSNGYTENSDDIFTSHLPYLTSVESKWDEVESPVFSSKNEISKQEFLRNLNLEINKDITINNIKKTQTGRIKSLDINGKTFESSEIRKIFNLKSTSFKIELNDDKVVFNVLGFGHGVGMSQYGANGMAKEGYNYMQILKHYYKNCDIKKIN